MKLVVNGQFDSVRAQKIVPDLEIVLVDSQQQLVSESADAEIAIGISNESFPLLLRTAKRLRWVHTPSAGVDHYLCPEFAESEVTLTCAKDGPAGPNLAEHAFALLLALTRNVAVASRQSTWRRSELSRNVWELGGKTLGIVGYGGVGREIARRALAFDMSVIATKKTPYTDPLPAGISVFPSDEISQLLENSDAVVICAPDTPETIGLFDDTAFGLMKSSAYIVNVGRGRTINTVDLVAAIERGEIAGAGLDVTDPEPLPDGHPLWQMEQVVITPHIAGAAGERAIRNNERVIMNLERYMSGEPMIGVVDKKLGY